MAASLARSGKAYRNSLRSWKRKSVTHENSLVPARGQGRHDLAAVKTCWHAAGRLTCHLRAYAVRGDHRDGKPVFTWLDNERRCRAVRGEGHVRGKPVIRDHHGVLRLAPTIEVDRRPAPVRHDQPALDGSARGDLCLRQDEPVCEPAWCRDQPGRHRRSRAHGRRPGGWGPRGWRLNVRGAAGDQQASRRYGSSGEQVAQMRLGHSDDVPISRRSTPKRKASSGANV